jgi:hypothetical protein
MIARTRNVLKRRVNMAHDPSALLTEIIDHFTHAEEGPGDAWAHDDEFASYALDYRGKDGTVFWLDMEKNGTISVTWKPAGADRPKCVMFRAVNGQ